VLSEGKLKSTSFLIPNTHAICSLLVQLTSTTPALVRIVFRDQEPVPRTKNFSDANFMLAELSTRRAVDVMDICFCLKAEDNTVIMRQKRRIDD
jgi:hypothetical protein